MLPRNCALILILAVALSACASRPMPAVAVALSPPIPVPVAVPMPAGAYPGMPVPTLLDDGGYATPNVNLSVAGAVWHLRAGLNFAALGCRGPEEASIIASYNALLAAQKPVLASAEKMLIAEYRVAGGDARDAYDDAMTRLYNYYALAPARPALCATAERLLAEAATIAPDAFPAFAEARLPELDRAFTDFYRAYDAWRGQRPQVTYAVTANVAAAPLRPGPWIDVDPAVLRLP